MLKQMGTPSEQLLPSAQMYFPEVVIFAIHKERIRVG